MPKLVFFLASNSTSVDARTNSLSIFEVIEELQTPGFPTMLRRADFVSLWQRQSGDENQEYEQRLRIVAPDRQEVASLVTRFKMAGRRHRMIGRFLEVPLPMAGTYQAELCLRIFGTEDWGIPVRMYSMPVRLSQGPPG
ncbi:MAG: hypothetical protein NTW86_14270 [Candidatus Sumerlaeota bacterium]|nr:hypothetical protein [Candidatus Sumerlaeota bacterium]